MSTVKVEQARAYLRVIHTAHDALIQELIDGAEDEARLYLNRATLPRAEDASFECNTNDPAPAVSDSDDLAPAVRMGIYMIIQAQYEGMAPDQMQTYRHAAEVKWQPYRIGLGV